MFTKKTNEPIKAEILMSGQTLSFKLDEQETSILVDNLEKASYDFKEMVSIKLYHPNGNLKSVINPLQIQRIWFS